MDQAQELADEAGEAVESFNPRALYSKMDLAELEEAAASFKSQAVLKRESDYEELKQFAMSFKSRSEVSASSSHTQYGYGILAIGAALATAAFFNKKRQQKAATFVNESEPLNKLRGDSEFQMV